MILLSCFNAESVLSSLLCTGAEELPVSVSVTVIFGVTEL